MREHTDRILPCVEAVNSGVVVAIEEDGSRWRVRLNWGDGCVADINGSDGLPTNIIEVIVRRGYNYSAEFNSRDIVVLSM